MTSRVCGSRSPALSACTPTPSNDARSTGVFPYPRSRAADPGERAAPAVERNDIEAQPAAAFAASQLYGVEACGREGQQAHGSENDGRLATARWSREENPRGISRRGHGICR